MVAVLYVELEILLAPFTMHRKLLKEALLVTEHLVRQQSKRITLLQRNTQMTKKTQNL